MAATIPPGREFNPGLGRESQPGPMERGCGPGEEPGAGLERGNAQGNGVNHACGPGPGPGSEPRGNAQGDGVNRRRDRGPNPDRVRGPGPNPDRVRGPGWALDGGPGPGQEVDRGVGLGAGVESGSELGPGLGHGHGPGVGTARPAEARLFCPRGGDWIDRVPRQLVGIVIHRMVNGRSSPAAESASGGAKDQSLAAEDVRRQSDSLIDADMSVLLDKVYVPFVAGRQANEEAEEGQKGGGDVQPRIGEDLLPEADVEVLCRPADSRDGRAEATTVDGPGVDDEASGDLRTRSGLDSQVGRDPMMTADHGERTGRCGPMAQVNQGATVSRGAPTTIDRPSSRDREARMAVDGRDTGSSDRMTGADGRRPVAVGRWGEDECGIDPMMMRRRSTQSWRASFVRDCFRLTMTVLQSERHIGELQAAGVNAPSLFRNTWRLLEEISTVDQSEWEVCFASTVSQILHGFVQMHQDNQVVQMHKDNQMGRNMGMRPRHRDSSSLSFPPLPLPCASESIPGATPSKRTYQQPLFSSSAEGRTSSTDDRLSMKRLSVRAGPLGRLVTALARPRAAASFLDCLISTVESAAKQRTGCGSAMDPWGRQQKRMSNGGRGGGKDDRAKPTLAAAMELFEIAYERHPRVVLECCAARLCDERSNLSTCRECLSLMSRIHSTISSRRQQHHHQHQHQQGAHEEQQQQQQQREEQEAQEEPYVLRVGSGASGMGGGDSHSHWSGAAAGNLLRTVMYDPRVRIRRHAMDLLCCLRTDYGDIEKENLLYAALVKMRDQDSHVRRRAFEILGKFPFTFLHDNLKDEDWQMVFEEGLSSDVFEGTGGTDPMPGGHVADAEQCGDGDGVGRRRTSLTQCDQDEVAVTAIVEKLLIEFLTLPISGQRAEPSERLARLNFGKRFCLYEPVLWKHVERLMEMELEL
ncbi:hypothetical protein CBR_g21019 [Chara braunii]|uniref:Uncharacterized protein n=1 Tax=Chara braunii TaxID=69332 RepID=A0A388L0G0_CHABU|nr:hypothetical protein CBR_g21019 [Chara braunii]|eukprot:GBG75775.1 hypothetical protein CBR_g21019 [Chara braunii]